MLALQERAPGRVDAVDQDHRAERDEDEHGAGELDRRIQARRKATAEDLQTDVRARGVGVAERRHRRGEERARRGVAERRIRMPPDPPRQRFDRGEQDHGGDPEPGDRDTGALRDALQYRCGAFCRPFSHVSFPGIVGSGAVPGARPVDSRARQGCRRCSAEFTFAPPRGVSVGNRGDRAGGSRRRRASVTVLQRFHPRCPAGAMIYRSHSTTGDSAMAQPGKPVVPADETAAGDLSSFAVFDPEAGEALSRKRLNLQGPEEAATIEFPPLMGDQTLTKTVAERWKALREAERQRERPDPWPIIETRFPRIAAVIREHWGKRALDEYFGKLIIDDRGNRQ